MCGLISVCERKPMEVAETCATVNWGVRPAPGSFHDDPDERSSVGHLDSNKVRAVIWDAIAQQMHSVMAPYVLREGKAEWKA